MRTAFATVLFLFAVSGSASAWGPVQPGETWAWRGSESGVKIRFLQEEPASVRISLAGGNPFFRVDNKECWLAYRENGDLACSLTDTRENEVDVLLSVGESGKIHCTLTAYRDGRPTHPWGPLPLRKEVIPRRDGGR